MAKLLIDNNANVNVQDYKGLTPLHKAASAGNLFFTDNLY